MRRWLATLPDRGFTTQSAVLAAAVLLVYAGVAPVANSLSGTAGLAAAATAAGFCLAGAALALAVCRLLRGPQYALHGILIGMLLRMNISLIGGCILQARGGPLAEAGVLVYFVVFYPVTLFVETALLLPSDGQRSGRRRVSGTPVV